MQLNVAVTLSAQPGATVQLLVDGAVRTTAVVDPTGAVTLVLRPTVVELLLNPRVEVRYTAADDVGPTVGARLLSLL